MVMQLPEDERKELLKHLKRKWASINTAYQKQSLSMDSDQKKHRKEEIERLLAEVEKDIKTLERGDMILIMVSAFGGRCLRVHCSHCDASPESALGA